MFPESLNFAKVSIYTIQLLSSNQHFENRLDDYLVALSKNLDIQKVYVYRTEKSARLAYGILFGSFSSHCHALKAIKTLPVKIPKAKPFIRSVEFLKNRDVGS